LITTVDDENGVSGSNKSYEISTYKLGDPSIGRRRIKISFNSDTKVETVQYKGF
jgi:hypothetical protein